MCQNGLVSQNRGVKVASFRTVLSHDMGKNRIKWRQLVRAENRPKPVAVMQFRNARVYSGYKADIDWVGT